ncbi:MAG: DNA-directed RNA polymerase subunit alpha [Candidatus Kerfeldbacteria bacterium CG08_land_8_20_14_0_20_43_14]|uniref:DNA-directed RNA polymerase subunit alpha n=1 Tax=Candidatus Kerfeldbacteria bacterium CG08_land_8_20_14_0_20_43_14 TaxID=2014246 RepID=A0A2H0YPJ8_9BACT|nr:MAG: DNA-directed RNA polymerase subunit alpha [Candidatus Kerfeldbacteria bacterium CG08_land_8_20_14_0_20_43_14]
MEKIQLPSKVNFTEKSENEADFVIEPCYPGYGTTLGNALRRVLLSSLPGAAITAVKISGATHEFSTLPHVKEDMVDLILNLKGIRLKMFEGESAVVAVKVKGEKVLTAGDLKCPSNVEVKNPEHVIAHLTDKSALLEMELTVGIGRGYIPVEMREKERLDLGTVAIDAIYTPVKNVNFHVENVRVGQMTNYDKVTISVVTDGTVSPLQAFHDASKMLVEHFEHLISSLPLPEASLPEKAEAKSKKKPKKER